MKQFPHQEFIKDNNLDIQSLPEMLQKRIKGFDELEEDLQHTTDEDNEKLVSKLETLSHELAEDLEEHFEEHLENNDQDEEVQQEIVPEPVHEEPAPEPEIEPAPEPTDEEILEGLFADKKHHVLPSELQGKGFKASLNSKRVLVGKFCLHRGKYDTCYQIILKSE